jgi:ABC-type nitrate/sulfonate/bicarbonate transport system substrate-binding protein
MSTVRILFLVLLALVSLPGHVAAANFTGITLGLVSTSWNTQLPSAVATRAGFFKEEGLEVRGITITRGGPVMMAMLASGEAQFVISGVVAMLRGIASGFPAVIVGGTVDKLDFTLLGAKGLIGVNDLRGKVIGVTGAGSSSEFAVVESLKRKGLVKDRDYTLVYAGDESVRVAALQTGRVHAIPVSAGRRLTVEKEGFPVLLEVGKVLPEFPSTVLVVTKVFAASSPDKVVGMLKALAKAIDLIRRDKDRAIEMGKAHGLPGDPIFQRRALDYMAEDFQVRLKTENLAAYMNVLGIGGEPEKFFDDSFLKRALSGR